MKKVMNYITENEVIKDEFNDSIEKLILKWHEGVDYALNSFEINFEQLEDEFQDKYFSEDGAYGYYDDDEWVQLYKHPEEIILAMDESTYENYLVDLLKLLKKKKDLLNKHFAEKGE